MQTQVFDEVASNYDSEFSHSLTGNLQRQMVWQYLRKVLATKSHWHVLELNCGTGEDAIFFAQNGCDVLATDISIEMLSVAKQKAMQAELLQRVSFQQLDLGNLENIHFEQKFDLVFSNFGGLNCINEAAFKALSKKLHSWVKPEGRFIAVIMSKFCIWETLWFLAKFQWKTAFRRLTNQVVSAKVGNQFIDIWYYSTRQVHHLLGSDFKLKRKRPIGLFAPPSYMESFMGKHPQFFNVLAKAERKVSNYSFGADLADHYLIDMQLKQNKK